MVLMIKDCIQINEYCILMLESEKPKTGYSKYIIDGIEYEPAPLYDMPKAVAIKATGNYKGKLIKFK